MAHRTCRRSIYHVQPNLEKPPKLPGWNDRRDFRRGAYALLSGWDYRSRSSCYRTPLLVAYVMAQISDECGTGHNVAENLHYTAGQMIEAWPSWFPTIELGLQRSISEQSRSCQRSKTVPGMRVADFINCGCLPYVKVDDVVNVTERLNGGLIGLSERSDTGSSPSVASRPIRTSRPWSVDNEMT